MGALGAIARKAGSFLFHVAGGHAAKTILTGATASPLVAAYEIVGWRAVVMFFVGYHVAKVGVTGLVEMIVKALL